VIAVGALGIADLPHLLSRENLRPPGGGGRASGGRRLGVQLSEDTRIDVVIEGGLAPGAGLKVGDHIVRIGDTLVSDSA
jgi:hypothetical protein